MSGRPPLFPDGEFGQKGVDIMSVRKELEDEIRSMETRGKTNYSIHYVLSIFAVLASFTASILAAIGESNPLILAIISALPAALLIASERFNFGARTRWYYKKHFALKSILSALEYEGLTEAEASKRRTVVYAELEENWPGIIDPSK